MYLYKIKIHNRKKAIREWFFEELQIGHTYAGSAGSETHCLFDVLELVDTIEK